jgi:Helix-turn-helix domain
MTTDSVRAAREELGRQLRARREAAGYTQQELADLLGYSRPRVAGAEKGDGCARLFWQGCDKILGAKGALLVAFTEIEALRRRETEESAAIARAERAARGLVLGDEFSPDVELAGFTGRSHKFITAHLGSAAAEHLMQSGMTSSAQLPWLDYSSVEVGHSNGVCRLYLWPFGTAVFHLVEDLDMPSMSRLAVWRIRSYEENLAWATSQLRHLAGMNSIEASYVLSLYWIDTPKFSDEKLETALKIMCSPRVLLQREPGQTKEQQAQAERVERTLLANGFDHSGIASFGLSGVSTGYASWSGVVYYPSAPDQALTESDLVNCELAVQSIWAYCEHVNNQVETGNDPIVPDKYSWRFLRGAKSRLINPRSQETGQHRAMRSSIVETSGLAGHLDQAIEVLYQIHGKAER